MGVFNFKWVLDDNKGNLNIKNCEISINITIIKIDQNIQYS